MPSRDEEFIAVHTDHAGHIWILSNKKIYRLDNIPIETYEFPFNDSLASNLYRIRNNTYFSDAKDVYGFVSESKTWEIHAQKETPQTVSVDHKGNTYLMFSDHRSIKIHRENAIIMANYSLPENEKVLNIVELEDAYFMCTENNLYLKSKASDIELISTIQMPYYNVIQSNQKTFVFSKGGIFEIVKDSLSQILPSSIISTFPPSKNHFIWGGDIISFNKHQLLFIDIESNDSRSIDLSPLSIVDILYDREIIYLLTNKSIISVNINKLFQPAYNIVGSMPLPCQILSGQLHDFGSEELWVKGQNRVLSLNKSDLKIELKPIIKLNKITTTNGDVIQVDSSRNFSFNINDLPLSIDYFSNNLWSENQSYVFHIAGGKENISKWQNSSTYQFNPQNEGNFLINAKMRDEIFGEDIFSDTIHIDIQNTSFLSNKSLLIIPLVLFFAMILGYFTFKSK